MFLSLINSHGTIIWNLHVLQVTVDSSINTIDVRVNGEVVIMLTHHVKNEPAVISEYAKLSIILGDLPANSQIQLLRPVLLSHDMSTALS